MKAIMLGIIAVFAYGLFVGAKSMIDLYKADGRGRKLFWQYLLFFVISPCIFCSGYYIIDKQDPNVWLVAPLLLLAIAWFFMGFFIQSAYRNLPTRKEVVQKPAEAKKRVTIAVILFVIGLVIWIYGFIKGYPRFNDVLLVLCLYFIVQGVLIFMRSFKYLKEQPKHPKSKQKIK